MNKRIILMLLITWNILLISCGGSSGNNGGTDDDNPMATPAPTAAQLLFPENQTECTEGEINPNDSSRSTINFRWEAGDNTENYRVTVTNLNSGNSQFVSTTSTNLDITLLRGEAYSWQIASSNTTNTTTANSEVFVFYNQGEGITNYAPFPATTLNPSMGENIASNGETVTIDFQWESSDLDSSNLNYRFILSTSNNLENPIFEESLENNTVSKDFNEAGVYYWQILTSDSEGNTSASSTFEFRINQ
jgi:hypothetical protein